MRLKLLIMLFFTVSVTGCVGPRYFINVDGLAAPEKIAALDNQRYILIPGNGEVSPGDLQFQEYAGYVRRALAGKGFVEAGSVEEANIAILVTYGISSPQQNIGSYLIPTWGQTGVASAYSSGTITTNGTNSASYSGTTTYAPTYGVTGYASNTYSYNTYTRGLSLTAYDFQSFLSTGAEVELWRTIAVSTGSSGDLRRVMPMLVAAAQTYMAINTHGEEQLVLRENDDTVVKIRGQRKPD